MHLDYNKAFHVRGEVTFATGHRATLHALHQWLTYSGWLEGRPTREWNDRIVARALRKAEACCAEGAAPVLIPPDRRPYLRDTGEIDPGDDPVGRTAEWLPVVTCVGVFLGPTARDQSKHVGVLSAVWFQPEYAPPIGEPSAGRLRDLNWIKVATDVEL
jgi:hypothetical protein